MLEFLIDNIFAMFVGRVFQQTVGISMGTNCVSPLIDLFFLFAWDRLHVGASQEKRKEASPIL